MDYRRPELIAGAGVHVSSIRPRTKSVVGSDTYKVDERVTGVSAEAHLKYTHERFLLSAKSVLGTNLTQTSTVGGYGITSVDPRTGEQTYTPLRTSATWLNVSYGKTWRPALFFGYLKSLGASTEVSDVLGTGTNLDQLLNATAELTYNRGNWKLGAEYSLCNAWYGDEFSAKAKALSSHTVMNHRVVMTAIYQF